MRIGTRKRKIDCTKRTDAFIEVRSLDRVSDYVKDVDVVKDVFDVVARKILCSLSKFFVASDRLKRERDNWRDKWVMFWNSLRPTIVVLPGK